MKKYLILLPLLFIVTGLRAQTDTVSPKINKIPHKRVDAAAHFMQGDFKNYIATHLQYNHKTDHNITGNIVLLVVIEADGGIHNVTVFKSLSQIIDQEVVNIIKASPKWQPAMLNGQKVSMDIVFNIDIAIKGKPATTPNRNSLVAIRPPLVTAQKQALVASKPLPVVVNHNTPAPVKANPPVITKKITTQPTKKPAVVIAKVIPPVRKSVPPVVKKPAPVIAKVIPPVKKPLPLVVKKPAPVIAKVILPVKKPVPPVVKKPEPVVAKIIPPVKKPVPPIVKKPEPVIAKVIPPVKKPVTPVAKKAAPVIAKVIPPVNKPAPQVIKKPEPIIARVIPPVKKPAPPVIKKPEPVIAKVIPPVKKPAPPVVKKATPLITKVIPPVKKPAPPVVKKPEPLIAKKEEPVIAKKPRRVVARADLFHPTGNYPIFPGGGLPAFFRYLGENIVYPPDSKKAGISGNVVLTFTVNEEGNIEDVEIISSPSADLGQEAIRVLLASPRWKPAKQNGTPVPVSYEIPIKFTLSEKAPAEKTTN